MINNQKLLRLWIHNSYSNKLELYAINIPYYIGYSIHYYVHLSPSYVADLMVVY